MNIEDFGEFFSAGQKYESDIRGLVICETHHHLDRSFRELSDLATVDTYGRAQHTITYRSGAKLKFVFGDRERVLPRIGGMEVTHVFVLGDVDKGIMNYARTCLRTTLPTYDVRKNIIYLDA